MSSSSTGIAPGVPSSGRALGLRAVVGLLALVAMAAVAVGCSDRGHRSSPPAATSPAGQVGGAGQARVPPSIPAVSYPARVPDFPPAGPGQTFVAEACGSPVFCVAVGTGPDQTHLTQAVISTWSGSSWASTPSPPSPGGQANNLSAVSCASASFCVAVGRFEQSGHPTQALVESWDGRRWSVVPVAGASGDRPGHLTSVSCAYAAFCAAAGSFTGGPGPGPLVVVWDGHSWRAVPVPLPPGATGAALTAISCPYPPFCAAAGSFVTVGGQARPFIVQTRGGAWVDAALGGAAAGEQAILTQLSCTSGRSCRAAGAAQNGTATRGITFTWDGTGWTAGPG